MKFFNEIHRCLSEVPRVSLDATLQFLQHAWRVVLVGNGGSAAIASHIAVDYTKNAGKEAIAFNDASLLTCFGNDYGYDRIFEQALLFYNRPGDVLVAISSSGKSKNILSAVSVARKLRIPVITMSGFDSENPLRMTGDVNIHIDSHDYGVVEICHLAVLHSLVGQFSAKERLVA